MHIPNPLTDPFAWLAVCGWLLSGVVYALPEPNSKQKDLPFHAMSPDIQTRV